MSAKQAAAFKTIIRERLRENKPDIASSSLENYTSTLSALHKQMLPEEPKKADFQLAFFDDHTDEIIAYVKETTKAKSTIKNRYQALLNLTGNDKYKEPRDAAATEVDASYATNKLSERELDNLITYDDCVTRIADLKKALKTGATSENYTRYLLLGLMSPVYLVPRRNEWGMVKVRDFDTGESSKDNYYAKGKFVFNTYKSAKKYGRQEVALPDALKADFNKWAKLNRSDWLFGKPLSSTAVNRVLSDIFGKQVGCDMLRMVGSRHAWDNGMTAEEAKNRALASGHSVDREIQYAKTKEGF